MKKRVMVGLSGGIDSSVAAYLLKEQGYEVEGVTMTVWKEGGKYHPSKSANSCFKEETKEEIEKTQEIADKIGIKYSVIDLSQEYEREVLENFRSEYLSGRTPNPCLWCNRKIKFGLLMEKAREIFDFDYFATGHYARVCLGENGRYQLEVAKDRKKDQTYFLSRLTQEQLSSVLFPHGDYYKSEVREIDRSLSLHENLEEESQDFYSGDYAELLDKEDREGEIVFRETGEAINTHSGFWHYTVGQRKGLKTAYKEPLYVLSVDPDTNRVYVGVESDTYSTKAIVGDISFLGESSFSDKVYGVKIRSVSPQKMARVRMLDEGKAEILFEEKAKAVAPGQSAVIYDGDRVIASSIIESSI